MRITKLSVRTFAPGQELPNHVICPHQVHGTRICEVITGRENLSDCDGVWTRDFDLRLGIRTADCAPIALWDRDMMMILHAGWRGLVGGIVEKGLELFADPERVNVHVAPLLPTFEIQRDTCYDLVRDRFGEQFFTFTEDGRVLFHFEQAIESILPQAIFDGRSTYDDAFLASWRRDKTTLRNVTVIGNLSADAVYFG